MGSYGAIARRGVLAIMCWFVLVSPSSAFAGRLIATGHDADHHCGRITEGHQQCHFFQVAVDYVRAGAPDPSKPVLVLDRGALDVVTSLDRVYGPGVMPRTVLDPRSPEFAQAPIRTDLYSAIIIASSSGTASDSTPQDLNELTSTPDSDAINARAAALRRFFDDGGGIYVNSGNQHGDDPSDPYYAFLPLEVQGAARVSAPFTLTSVGRALGLVEHDVDCCPTHNVFAPFSPDSPLRALDVDRAGLIVSVAAETPSFAGLAEPAITPAVVRRAGSSLAPSFSCVRRRTITLRIRPVRGRRFSRANIYIGGKRVKRVLGRKITRPIKVKVPATTKSIIRMRIVITTTGKRKLTIRRTYRNCT